MKKQKYNDNRVAAVCWILALIAQFVCPFIALLMHGCNVLSALAWSIAVPVVFDFLVLVALIAVIALIAIPCTLIAELKNKKGTRS